MTITQRDHPRAAVRDQDSNRSERLQIEVSLAEAWPWPAMSLRAAVRHRGALYRLRQLKAAGDGFLLNETRLALDPVGALILRTICGLHTQDGVAYRAGRDAFAAVLALLRQAGPGVTLRESERIARVAVTNEPPLATLALHATRTEHPLRLDAAPSFCCAASGRPLGLPLQRGRHWWAFEDAVAKAPELPGDIGLRALFDRGPRSLEGVEAWALLEAARAHRHLIALRITPADLAEAAVAPSPRPALRIEAADASAGHIAATLVFEAGGARFSPQELLDAAAEGAPCLKRDGVWCRVDAAAVEAARKAVAERSRANGKPGRFVAQGEEVPELLAWAKEIQKDAGSPWNIYVADQVEGAHRVCDEAAELRLKMDVEEDGDGAWFKVEAGLEIDGKPLTPEQIRRLMRQRKKWLRDGARWRRLNAQAFEQFRLHAETHGFQPAPSRHGLPAFRFRAAAREKVEELFSLAGTVEHSEKYRAFVERLGDFEQVEPCEPPASLTLPLRCYQLAGYRWMRFLARYGLNGILADDMGLGKTAQTIAILAHFRDERGSAPSLIVCPTSLVDNWRAEFRKFCPDLKVLRYGGSPARRDRLRQRICEKDVVLATYATVRNDASLLAQEQWRYVVLDEAHAIKNASAAVTKAVKTIPSRHRLALTGTPVQNRLDELWSIFDFLMPSFLGHRASFFRGYEEPIAKGQSPLALRQEQAEGERVAEHLRARIKPFVLRRLKSEVARELPEKIEQDIPCALGADQAALYRKFAKSGEAKRAVKELEEKGAGRAQTEILTALMTLRKICNHPDLVYLQKELNKKKRLVPMPGYEERSGKLAAFGDLLDQCKAGGHRALVFCQLTSMLDILEHFLMERGERWLRLDGSTPPAQRQDLVDRFNRDENTLCFLISTRAGGSGLNLVGADTVIFYDHDWNPANDRQAQDRAYRIGQTRNVNVYRLVTRGTFEEKVLERQRLKLNLADAVVRHDAAGFKDLSREELLSLFTLGE